MVWARFSPLNKSWFNQVEQMQHEFNRLIDRWSVPAQGNQTFPAFNVWEANDAVVVQAEVSGMELDDLEIFVTGNNHLTIKGERKFAVPEKGVQHRQEREFGKFVRSVTLPFPVNSEKVEARLENGVLHLNLPKHEAAKPRRINVKS